MQYQTVSESRMGRKSDRPVKVRAPLMPKDVMITALPETQAEKPVELIPVPTDRSVPFVVRHSLFVAAALFAGVLLALALLQPYLPGIPK